jgi:hypothetical protein
MFCALTTSNFFQLSEGSEVNDNRVGRITVKKENVDTDRKRELDKANFEKVVLCSFVFLHVMHYGLTSWCQGC